MVVLDAWALLAYLRDEPAAEHVQRRWLSDGAAMCSVNLGEALYAQTRAHGHAPATEAIAAARDAMTVVDPDWDLVSTAAAIKARGGISYADAFCIATARHLGAPLLTGDPEILDRADDVEVVDLRVG